MFFGAAAAFAAEPDEVAAGIADDGVFVEFGASTTESEIGALVREARNDGENLSIAVLAEEPVSGAVTFADAVVDRAGRGLVIVIAPESVGYAGAGDVYTVDDLETALDVAFERGGDDGDFARSIVESLTGRSVDVDDPVSAGDSGGGGGLVVLLVIVVIVVGGVFWIRSRSHKRQMEADTARIDAAKAEVQRRIDDVANDLLEMEDEVRMADNPNADRFYNEAGDTYRAVSDAFPAASSPAELVDLSNRLDVAIWQLDTAEAILDDRELPERPQPRRLDPEPTPERSIDTSRLPAPPSTYDRRPSRRSSYGAGSSMMDTLLQLGLAYAAGRRSSQRVRPGGGGGLFGGLGGSASRGSSRSSSRRGTGGRVRGGRSRRRR
jgi:hypothetical protein